MRQQLERRDAVAGLADDRVRELGGDVAEQGAQARARAARRRR
jgi:hypothetical protein